MLESQRLWLSPPRLVGHGRRRRVRTVRAGSAEGDELGSLIDDPIAWLPWRATAAIAAYEAPDQSAVFCGRRAGWVTNDWDVVDADGLAIGYVRGRCLLAADTQILGWRRAAIDGAGGRIVDGASDLIANWRNAAGGTEVEFASAAIDQPFAKMIVLIAIVTAL